MAAPGPAAQQPGGGAPPNQDPKCKQCGHNAPNRFSQFCSRECGVQFHEVHPEVCRQCLGRNIHVDRATGRNLHMCPVCSPRCKVLFLYRIPCGVNDDATLQEYTEQMANQDDARHVHEDLQALARGACLQCKSEPSSEWSPWCSRDCRTAFVAANPQICKQCGVKPSKPIPDFGSGFCSPECVTHFESGFPGRVTFANVDRFTQHMNNPIDAGRRRGVRLMLEDCIICLDVLSSAEQPTILNLGCGCRGRFVHEVCGRRWLQSRQKTCPCCKGAVSDDKLVVMKRGIDYQ